MSSALLVQLAGEHFKHLNQLCQELVIEHSVIGNIKGLVDFVSVEWAATTGYCYRD